MELLTGGDRQVLNATDFLQQVSPFPENENFLVSNPTAAIHSSPPRKLRPIRANGRSPSSSQVNDMPLNGCGLDEALENIGALVDQVCGVNGESSELFKPPMKAEDSVTDCTGSGGSGPDGRNWDPSLKGPPLEVESSSSSDDDSSPEINEGGSRKRKRKTRKRLEVFLESLLMKVLDNQERMHKQLIETMEQKEKERIIREEAWRQQEMERMKRDEEVRAQENARNLALISFIQDVMGHKVEFTQPVTKMAHPGDIEEKDGSNVPRQKDFNTDSSNRRWSKAEVQTLIMLRAASEQKLQAAGAKFSNIWDEISAGMCNMGYNRTAKKCKEKWENINKYFRKLMGNGGRKPNENSSTCPYFQELHILYNNGSVVNPGNASDHTNI